MTAVLVVIGFVLAVVALGYLSKWVGIAVFGVLAGVNNMVATSLPKRSAPGWYADPYGEADVRWWTGTQWTTTVADLNERTTTS